MSADFTPITTQEELDRIMTARLDRQQRALVSERENVRTWEKRAKQNASDRDTWQREARKWERLAKENLAVIKAHEGTIRAFIEKLDDVLNDD